MENSFRSSIIFPAFFTFIFCQNLFGQRISGKEALALLAKNSAFLNLSEDDLKNAFVSDAYFDHGANTDFIYLQQTFRGIQVYNSIQVIALKNDQVVSVTGNWIAKIEEKVTEKITPAVTPQQAVSVAARELHIVQPLSIAVLRTDKKNQNIEFSSSISKENITAKLIWVPAADGKVSLAWQVKILPYYSNAYWLLRINANDQTILGKDNLTLSCNWNHPSIQGVESSIQNKSSSKCYSLLNSPQLIQSSVYRVIPFAAESMKFQGGTPALVNNPWLAAGSSNAAVTLGWHNDGSTDFTYTRGNNVWAKEDHAGNDNNLGMAATSSTAAPFLNFDFAFNPALPPDTASNKNFAITQLFYWNNIMHDVSYQYGFDEVAGNFQMSNLGRGGAGNDFVYADAQDGSGSSNADFSTPPDGSNPRMQMYLWAANQYKVLDINSPASLAGQVTSVEGAVSNTNLLKNVGPVTGDIVLYNDDISGTSHLACSVAANPGFLAGKIAMIDRGTCNFTVKIKNAQNAGAIAVIMVNNVGGDTLLTMSGSDNTITIPAVMIFESEGNAIKTILAENTAVNATLNVSTIKLDGDMDNGIMAHEYTHGITTRLTGGPANATCLTNKEQGGEGWSDYIALMMTTNWTTALPTDGNKSRSLGTYVVGEEPTDLGIRTYPYSTDLSINPWTYGQLAGTGGEVHVIGELWAATLWDMTWNIIMMDGINPNLYNSNGTGGNSVAMKLVMLGLKLQPCQPGFLDARNGILKADTILFNGKYSCAIWNAFARRGMGVFALQGSSNSTTDQVADYSIPASAIIKKTVDKAVAAQNDLLTYTLKVYSQCASVSNYKIVDTLPQNVTYVSGGTYDALKRTVSFNIPSLTGTASQDFSFKVRINNQSYFIPDTLLNEPVSANTLPVTLVATTNVPSIEWSESSFNHSSPYSLKSASPASPTEQILTSRQSYSIAGNTELIFWQNYNTEASHDGGVVELSTDDGSTWFDAGPYMRMNGYNSTINTNSNLENKRAFSGLSNGFIQTIINLSAFENRSVKFRFRFVSDSTKSGTGWYVDDIVVNQTPAVYNIGRLIDTAGQLASISDTLTSITTQVLPLAWGSFTAEKRGRSSVLKWTTLQEINTDQFFVERSTDGVHFYSIAIINASGNTNGVTLYSTIDSAPSRGLNFYRIRQTDHDGLTVYSEVQNILFDFLPGILIISPNPAKDHISLNLSGNKEILHGSLINDVGQTVLRFLMKDEYNTIPVNTLPAGIYYIKISGGKFSTIQKLVIGK